MPATAEVLKAARTYIERGWSIIPLVKDGKIPPTGFDLEGAYREPLSFSELETWLRMPEVGNIGIVMGNHSGLVAADIDDINRNADFETVKTGLIQRTPSGGRHLVFQWDSELPQLNGHIGAGVDYIVSNKYIVAAPSHAKGKRNGQEYEGDYEWELFEQPAPFPRWVLGDTFESMSISTFNRQEGQALLNFAFANGRFVSGRHNETIFYGSLILASDGMSEDMILNIMTAMDKRDPTPQGQSAVRNAVHRAFEIGRKHFEDNNLLKVLHTPEAIPAAEVAKATPTTQVEVRKQPENQLPTLDYDDLRQYYLDYETRWLVDGWIQEAGIMMLAAPPERYKTWLALDMAVSIVTGRPFLDTYPVTKTGNVLIIQQEDFPANVVKRLDLIVDAKYENYPADIQMKIDGDRVEVVSDKPLFNYIYFHTQGQLSLDDTVSLGKLYETVKEVKPVLVIIDPFYSLTNKDDYGASAAGVIREVIKQIRSLTNASFLFVHHTKKTDDKFGDPTGRQAQWGSQFINAAMEGMIILARQQGQMNNEVTAYRNFKEATSGQPVNLQFNIDKTKPTRGERYRVATYEGVTDLEKQVKVYLTENGQSKLKDIYEAFEDSFNNKSALSQFLERTQGIEKVGYGTYALAPDARGVEDVKG